MTKTRAISEGPTGITLLLTEDELILLSTLVDFHQGDPADEYYDSVSFNSLAAKVNYLMENTDGLDPPSKDAPKPEG